MAGCTLCSVARPGYIIDFRDSDSRIQVEQFLRSRQQGTWEITPAGKLWIDAQVVVKYVDYWSQCLNPESWMFRKATKVLSGKFNSGDALPWSSVRKQIPEFWIDHLIASNSLQMMYQPIVDLSDGVRLIAYETLVRGFDANGKMIAPDALFQQAKEQEKLFALDRHCRVLGVRAAAQTPADTLIFINFIPTSIYKPEHCLQTTMEAAKEYRIEPSRIVFEVVESEYVEDVDHLKSIFDYYRRNGVKCALDDVGAGFNDISMLEALQPDVVKLDRSIADGIARDPRKQEQAERILHVACQVGARVLAEGIERIDDALLLADMGYLWQQGYLYGKPAFDVLQPQLRSLEHRKAA